MARAGPRQSEARCPKITSEAPSERDRAALPRPGHDFRGQAGRPGDDFDDTLLGEATKRRLELAGGFETLESESLVYLVA